MGFNVNFICRFFGIVTISIFQKLFTSLLDVNLARYIDCLLLDDSLVRPINSHFETTAVNEVN